MIFKDRRDAGRRLAAYLKHHPGREPCLVLGLPRGGVPVAYEVALALDAPLDVFVVRKLGVPGHEELAMGAIATGGVVVLNHAVVRGLQIPEEIIRQVTAVEQQELARREQAYRGQREAPAISARRVILIDDGLATGASMASAVRGVRLQSPERIVVAVPVAARQTLQRLRPMVDELVCVEAPEPFYGVGQWYEDFRQMTDEEVRELLHEAHQRRQRHGSGTP
jgi:predicted phosphoribosyltransferase